MPESSLFGHLALKFGAHPENLATEALCYILQGSLTARSAFERLLADLGLETPTDLRFRTQAAGEDDSIPDMVGSDDSGRPVLILEAKFWAGLTGQQPAEYLKRMPSDRPGALVVLAPAQRFVTLWSELLRRCREAGMTVEESTTPTAETRRARLLGKHSMGLISWRALEGVLTSALTTAGEMKMAANVEQLGGLCARMDVDAFLPIRGDEMAATTPQRIYQYTYLVDELVDMAARDNICSKGNLKVTPKRGQYGRYMMMHDAGVYLHTDVRKWYQHCQTPFWLEVYGLAWGGRNLHLVRQRLASLEHEIPPRLISEPGRGTLSIPLYLPIGEDKGRVLDALLGQRREIHSLLIPRDAIGTIEDVAMQSDLGQVWTAEENGSLADPLGELSGEHDSVE